MDRIAGSTALANANGTGKTGFVDLNSALGILGTIVTAAWLNAIQEELCNIVEQFGGTLDGANHAQVYQAIKAAIAAALPGAACETVAGIVELATIAEAKAGTDITRAVTPAGLAAAVGAAVSALVNSAPGALDTLSELASALNDDANFGATVTNALAAKAPLISPVLIGTPMAPTAAAGTSTGQLATTAFVAAALAAATANIPPPERSLFLSFRARRLAISRPTARPSPARLMPPWTRRSIVAMPPMLPRRRGTAVPTRSTRPLPG